MKLLGSLACRFCHRADTLEFVVATPDYYVHFFLRGLSNLPKHWRWHGGVSGHLGQRAERRVQADCRLLHVHHLWRGRMAPRVSIVVLNWNQYSLTSECLESLRRIGYPDFKIVVVDNGSHDGSSQRIKRNFPDVKLIESPQNLGVAGGRNLGVRETLEDDPDYVLFLDNDVVVDPDFLGELVNTAERDPAIGGVGPKIYYFDHPQMINHAVGRFYPRISHNRCGGSGELDLGQYDDQMEVDWISGCAGLFRRVLFDKVGFLDEVFSPYGPEDLDWSLRVRRAGYKLCFAPSARVWHKDSPGDNKTPTPIRNLVRGRVVILRKNTKSYDLPLPICFFIYKCLFEGTLRYLLKGDCPRARSIFEGLKEGITCKVTSRQSSRSVRP